MRRLGLVAFAVLLAIPLAWAGSPSSPEIGDECDDAEADDPLSTTFTDIEKAWFGFDPSESFPFGIHIMLCDDGALDRDAADNPLLSNGDGIFQTARWVRGIGWEVAFEPLWEETTWTVKVWTQGDGQLNNDIAKWRVCADGESLFDHEGSVGEIRLPDDRPDNDDPWIEVRISTDAAAYRISRDEDLEMLDGILETRARAGNYSINETQSGVDGVSRVGDYSRCGAPMATHDFAPNEGLGDGFFQLPQSGEENRFEQAFIEFPDGAPRVTISQDGSFSYPINMTSQAQWVRDARFTVDAPAGWQTSFEPQELPIPANGYNITTLDVEVPRHADTGAQTLTVTAAVSDTGRMIENITWTIPVKVREYPRSVAVTTEQDDKAVRPGNNVDYIVTIHNTGRLGDRYRLVLQDGPGWETTLATDNVTLAAGANAEVGLRVHVPADVTDMRDYTHSFVVTSKIDGVTSAEHVLTTGVLVPPDRDDQGMMNAIPAGADLPADYLTIIALGMLSIGVVVVAVLILLALGIL